MIQFALVCADSLIRFVMIPSFVIIASPISIGWPGADSDRKYSQKL